MDLDDVVLTGLEVPVRIAGEASDVEGYIGPEGLPALEHFGGTAGVGVGVDLDGCVRDVAEELVDARGERGGPGVVSIRSVVEAHAQDIGVDAALNASGERLDICAVGRGEGMAALYIRAVHRGLNVERSSRVLEEDGVVRARGIGGVDGRRADDGGAGRCIVHFDDVVPTGLEVAVRVTGEASDVEGYIGGERLIALEHLDGTPGIRVGMDLDGGVRGVAEELVGAGGEGRGPCIVTAGVVLEAHAQDVLVHGPGHPTG